MSLNVGLLKFINASAKQCGCQDFENNKNVNTAWLYHKYNSKIVFSGEINNLTSKMKIVC